MAWFSHSSNSNSSNAHIQTKPELMHPSQLEHYNHFVGMHRSKQHQSSRQQETMTGRAPAKKSFGQVTSTQTPKTAIQNVNPVNVTRAKDGISQCKARGGYPDSKHTQSKSSNTSSRLGSSKHQAIGKGSEGSSQASCSQVSKRNTQSGHKDSGLSKSRYSGSVCSSATTRSGHVKSPTIRSSTASEADSMPVGADASWYCNW
eukprot:gnl/MRDRNA2_/MRDRNA2_95040_c0_seq1.p1 gnl/MRDRNA2_/MRDRNA2_95040_c0~~gnl/MRDRNA2_/MRDRNA2_95040_c0_seq1.p1  ORF type:complete len:203 (+),score=21.97 gnl/MRDRNA2_/MRDRNA2_95040_c0_seq1:116-724(+)